MMGKPFWEYELFWIVCGLMLLVVLWFEGVLPAMLHL
jgi:hypothetical protein